MYFRDSYISVTETFSHRPSTCQFTLYYSWTGPGQNWQPSTAAIDHSLPQSYQERAATGNGESRPLSRHTLSRCRHPKQHPSIPNTPLRNRSARILAPIKYCLQIKKRNNTTWICISNFFLPLRVKTTLP